ncbi:hypothetical protein B1B04_09105 [Lysinibacillus sp. KCTC 33748]|uniref:LamG domain-containing protein n=1 Tax=unclassified Lysinibacillus TaxID=2636778 RepID=UPI0009A76288|nr:MULTISPECIES: LamG domain-containing protein [unclassified Lysinibacillus]OXS74274.1 hypothetical protein B1B04_09105 [Lysinibacillus sp. KCTC 33748]SKB63482.1 Concanavalin A-like lectin/glucanases superfamily protein [Lysinibacillus sp. AC-3]
MATTEQLMAYYGVAWFDFDEASGNVGDKLGNGYTGTVTSATRVGGWNGEGNSMSFNGSNSMVSFDNKILPLGEKTIGFKFKSTNYIATTQSIMETYTSASNNGTGYGIKLVSGVISVQFYTATNPLVTSMSISTPSNINLCDGKWHSIVFSWTGKVEDIAKLYLDDELVSISKSDKAEDSTNYSSNNLNIGAMKYTSYRYWYNGRIDDLQIYNKTLSPSDFTQKRLVVKTSDNKNLVLSPTSTRVKEIPNTAEYMMLAQGGIVKEIDSAVDSQPIDFTKTTTEYEIVTNNRTPLGKGRMFTIPIGTDFKTAMIEDNY